MIGWGGGKSKYKMQNIPMLMEKREKHTEGKRKRERLKLADSKYHL